MATIQTQPAMIPLAPGAPLVQVEHLTRVIGTRAQKPSIQDDITFTVPARTLFAINGPSGSGKSTVLNKLTGLDRPTSGRVVFAGQELRARRENALARWRGRHVGIVFQFFQLIPTSPPARTRCSPSSSAAGCRAASGGAAPSSASTSPASPIWPTGCPRSSPAASSSASPSLARSPTICPSSSPTGNLDSHSAHQVFDTLAALTGQGKTDAGLTALYALEKGGSLVERKVLVTGASGASGCGGAAASAHFGRSALGRGSRVARQLMDRAYLGKAALQVV